jgi:hypothetical protein
MAASLLVSPAGPIEVAVFGVVVAVKVVDEVCSARAQAVKAIHRQTSVGRQALPRRMP